MTDQCLPPAGTPAGTVCVLHYIGMKGWSATDEKREWTGSMWRFVPEEWQNGHVGATPEDMYRGGWRFVRVAGGADG